jgi:CPA2 family monovalent cation:H+ antiporter-2
MTYPPHLKDLLILLSASVSVAFLAKRLKFSATLGYLLAGLIIGPFALKFLSNLETGKQISDFGLIFLLFTIGLELPFQRLQVLRKYVFGLGTLQIVLTTTFFYVVCQLLGFSIEASLSIGIILSLSSTSVVLQILSEKGEFHTRFGRITFSVLLFQDLVVVAVLVSMSFFRDPSNGIIEALVFPLVKSLFGLVAVVLIGRVALRPIYKYLSIGDSPELFMGGTLLVILGTSFATSMVGISSELGAFLAGMLLAETEYRHKVEEDIRPFRGLLLGIFFMTIGMKVDLRFVLNEISLISSLLFGSIFIKIIILLPLVRIFQRDWDVKLKTAFLLSTGGEFVFVLVIPAHELGILDERTGQVLLTTAAISMMLTPILYKVAHRISKYFPAHKKVEAIETKGK